MSFGGVIGIIGYSIATYVIKIDLFLRELKEKIRSIFNIIL